MDIGKICNRNVITVGEVGELTLAAQLMREKHIGYLVVVKPSEEGSVTPIGVITDRDIVVAVVAREIDPRSLTVGNVMTRQPAVVDEATSVSTALQLMRRIGVRRLPVIGRGGVLVGVLSLDDVLDTLAGEMTDVAGSIRHERKMEDALLPPLAGTGLAVGALSGFFGIGGGFLIVPGLISATAMPLLNAIGSSLVSVFAFGATTAESYAASGLIVWRTAGLFVVGGLAGGYAGIEAAKALAGRKRMLAMVFSVVVAVVGLYVTARGLVRFIG
ncbi:MAG: TSUP family transporter [Steroidobacteraceae bacterium]